MADLSKRLLLECFDYDEDSGNLIWKRRPLNHFKSIRSKKAFDTNYAGNIAGATQYFNKKEYIRVTVDGVGHFAHRIIWIMTSNDDAKEIDHIDGNGLNNKLSNLRSVTREENGKNLRLYSNNKTGFHGIYQNEKNKNWYAQIKNSGKTIHLGYFKTKDKAISARKKAEFNFGFHENHGLRR